MPQSGDDEKRIRGGLKFLFRAGKAVVRAAALLQDIEEVAEPATVDGVFQEHTFEVAGNRYTGRMTQHQFEFLSGKTASVAQFADAISALLLKMNGKFLDALSDLSGSLVPPGKKPAGAAAAIDSMDPVVYGCCAYDSTEKPNVTKSFCLGALQGTSWYPGPCVQLKDATGDKPAGRRGKK